MEPRKDNQVITEKSDQQTEQVLLNWNKLEKYKFLQAVKNHGSRNMEILCQELSFKTREEIEEALKYYQSKASAVILNCSAKAFTNRKLKFKENEVPLSKWTNLLNNSYSFKELTTETATAFKIISEFDKMPISQFTENVDFKTIYRLLANALEGRTLPELNGVSAYVVKKCLLETIISTKGFISSTDLENCVDTMSLSNKLIFKRPSATEDAELATIQHLASQCSYNPLGVTVNFLKSSKNPLSPPPAKKSKSK